MTKRSGVGFVYFIIVLMTLLLRVSSALGVYDVLGVNGDVYFTLVVQVLIFGVLPVLGYYFIVKKSSNEKFLSICGDFGCKKLSLRNFLRTVVIGIGMIFVSGLVSYIWQSVLFMMGYKSTSAPTDYSSMAVLFSELFFVALLPGVFEEITHRGLLFAGYRETGWRFVLVSALLFALMHQNITQTGYTFFDGVIIALVMYYTGSVFPGIFIHFLNNAVSVTEGYIAQNGGFLSFITDIQEWFFSGIGGFLTFVAIGIVLMLLMLLLFKRMRDDGVKNGVVPKEFFHSGDAHALPLRRDVFFIVTMILGVAATLFSLVWGIIR